MTRSFLFILLLTGFSFSSLAQNIYTKDTWAARDKWQKVPEILEAIGLKTGQTIADIGSHQGYMTLKFSKQVGSNGKVYAVDVSRNQLSVLDDLIEDRKIGNIETVLGDYDDPKLPTASLDVAFIMDAYHEMDDYKDILRHIRKALKPEGKLVIMEPIGDDRRGWSRSRQEGKHEIDMKYVIDDLEEAGFKVLRQEDPFIDRTKRKHDKMWLLIAESIPNN
ncbi:MAG: methyltransferase domain-containing protein [Roseivirga sp.]|nr:methyltransferase domain-containing protein [Roseivirga sp.]